jgi:two-component system nitrate/nitrite response regulator NarL
MINTNVRAGAHLPTLIGSAPGGTGSLATGSLGTGSLGTGSLGNGLGGNRTNPAPSSGALELLDPPRPEAKPQKTVVVCDTQPVTAEGIRTVLAGNQDLQFHQVADSLGAALELARRQQPNVIMVDKAFGIQAILEWLNELRLASPGVGVVIWGVSVTEAEALRFLQAGARGILRKTAIVSVVLSCLRTVAEKRSWMEDSVFRDSTRSDRYPRSELTPREQQVLELVEQGFKNKEIALDLGIRPGTVKIHLKHIFEKTGVRGRYGLALSGLKDRGLASVPA